MKIHLATLFLSDFNFYTVVKVWKSCCLCAWSKRWFHPRSCAKSVIFTWPYRAAALVCFWDFSGCCETFQSPWGVWHWCWWVRYLQVRAGLWHQAHLLVLAGLVICWGERKINSFNSNMCRGTLRVLSGRDAALWHPNRGHRASSGSARASRIPTTPEGCGDMVGSLSFPFPLPSLLCTLAMVTVIAFESEESEYIRQWTCHYSCHVKSNNRIAFLLALRRACCSGCPFPPYFISQSKMWAQGVCSA